MIRSLLLALIVVSLAGCSGAAHKTLGAAMVGAEMTVAGIETANVGSPIVVSGTMTEKCPIAGCWFILQDRTGRIKVDTKNAGFVVVEVPLKTALAVSGCVTKDGTERIIDATAIRY